MRPARALGADLGEVFEHLGPVHGRVQDVAFLSARATHEAAVSAFGVVLRDRRRTLGTLVVRVGMDAQQAKLIGHPPKIWADKELYGR